MTTTGLPTIDSAITFLETQIEELDKRRARLVAAIDGLRMLADSEPEGEQQQVERRTASRPHLPAPPKTNGAGQDDRVLQALKSGCRGPMAIMQATGLSEYQVNVRLKALVASRNVVKTGTGPRNTQYHLA